METQATCDVPELKTKQNKKALGAFWQNYPRKWWAELTAGIFTSANRDYMLPIHYRLLICRLIGTGWRGYKRSRERKGRNKPMVSWNKFLGNTLAIGQGKYKESLYKYVTENGNICLEYN